MFFKENLKFLRKAKHFTQEKLSDRIKISRSSIAKMETESGPPQLEHLEKIARFFDERMEDLLNKDLSKAGRNVQAALSVDSVPVKGVFVVPQKAAAGYLSGYSDPEYIEELPRVYFPLYKGANYRAFEIMGDSMLPVPPRSIVFGKYLEQLSELKDNRCYIIVTKSEGIVYKRVKKLENQKKLLLISDNIHYEPYGISYGDVIEIWEAQGFFSPELPDATAFLDTINLTLEQIKEELKKRK